MTATMFDDIYVSLLPSGDYAYAGYIDGRYANYSQLKARFPHAPLVSIAVFAANDAQALDIEQYDATIPEAVDWLRRQLARHVYKPALYISGGRVDDLVTTLNVNHFNRDQYRIWSAHYGRGEHICGPHTCGVTQTVCDWTQWTDTYNGSSLDASELPGMPSFVPPTPPPPSHWTFGPPQHLTARAGHTNVALTWSEPANAPEMPAEYQVFIYKGTAPTFRTIVKSYPRIITPNPESSITSVSCGGLIKHTTYTVHVVAAGPDGTHIRPYTFAELTFKTGGLF